MLGWILVFMILSVTAVLAGTARGIGFGPAATTGVVFLFLLLAAVLTRTLRGHA